MNNFIEGNSQTELTERPVDVGKQLRRAREAGNLSIQSVAASLHLAPRVIIAMEENNFSQFQPVFAKGYLRNYGRLLNLPIEPLVESYNWTILPEQDPLKAPKQSSKNSKSPWGLYLLLSAGILSILVWVASKVLFPFEEIPASQSGVVTSPLSMSSTQTEDEKSSETSSLPTENLLTNDVAKGQRGQSGDKTESTILAEKPIFSVTADANQFVGPSKPETTKIQDYKTGSANLPAMANQTPAIQTDSQGPDTIAVHLSTTGWVGIRDHTGRRLIYEMIPAGTDRSFSGQAPFFVVLGNSPATRVEFNGKPFTPPKSKAGTVARFTIDQSGSLETGGLTVKKGHE